MKKTITTLLLVFSVLSTHAQQRWQQLPFNIEVNSGEQDWMPFATYIEADSTMYISGNFTDVNNVPCNVIRVFDNGGYDFMPYNPYHSIRCMAWYHGKLYAGGNGLSYWDGSTWNLIDSSFNTMVANLDSYDGKLLVTGVLDDLTGHNCWKVATWNDTIWEDVHEVNSLLSDCNYDAVNSVALYKDQLYLGGRFYEFRPNGDTLMNMIRFDGTKWTDVGSMYVQYQSEVRCLQVWKDTLYVSGQFTEARGGPGNSIAAWDGNQWSRLGAGLYMEHGVVEDMQVFNDELYACGIFKEVNGFMPPGQTPEDILGYAKWNGQQWCTMGTMSDNIIFRMGSTKNDLYVMGGFTHINNSPMKNIARWIGGNYTDTCSVAQEPTGISTLHEDAYAPQMYPNPSAGKFTLELASRPSSPLKFTMRSLTGSVVFETDIRQSTQIVDAGKQAGGLYFVTLSSADKRYTFKMVIR
ncbi:MAG: T9SS type A sorting domain-containing protein [Sphingobacteriales bacterium]|nr:MAG: T9SS type A sorting domain-containing protein [Sphingobacteriales bacterium]